ncbi:MAG: hypothetical protein K6E29_06580 [Cyanobacteria bacterium RUI128]|nr:hypothetical protein [Cyanobacteria bacterium RUI128]
MKVFYIDIDEFKTKADTTVLKSYADKEFKTEKRFLEHAMGRYLVKSVAKQFFGLTDTEIITDKKGKPYLKNSDLHFSISHSNNILIACFDNYPCGIDIEQIKKRNFDRFSEYYGEEFKGMYDFYKFWTLKEASYKLNETPVGVSSEIFQGKYYLTIVSANELKTNIKPEKYNWN